MPATGPSPLPLTHPVDETLLPIINKVLQPPHGHEKTVIIWMGSITMVNHSDENAFGNHLVTVKPNALPFQW